MEYLIYGPALERSPLCTSGRARLGFLLPHSGLSAQGASVPMSFCTEGRFLSLDDLKLSWSQDINNASS